MPGTQKAAVLYIGLVTGDLCRYGMPHPFRGGYSSRLLLPKISNSCWPYSYEFPISDHREMFGMRRLKLESLERQSSAL